MPLIADESRKHEYEADLAASTIGLGNYLSEALNRLGVFEMARSGWQGALYSKHPPVEYRIERAKEANGDAAQKPVSDISQPNELFKRIAPVVAILIVGALASPINSLGYAIVNRVKSYGSTFLVTPTSDTKEAAISKTVAFETSFGNVAFNRNGYLSVIAAYILPTDRTYVDNQVDASYEQAANAIQRKGAQISSTSKVTGVKILNTTGSPPSSVSMSVVFVLRYTFNNNVATPDTTIIAGLSGYAVTKETLQFEWAKGNWQLAGCVPVGYVSTGSGAPQAGVYDLPSGYQSP